MKELMKIKSTDGKVQYVLTPVLLKLGFSDEELETFGSALDQKIKSDDPLLDGLKPVLKSYLSNLPHKELAEIESAELTSDNRLFIKYSDGTTNENDGITIHLQDKYPKYEFSPASPNFFNREEAKQFVNMLIEARDRIRAFFSNV